MRRALVALLGAAVTGSAASNSHANLRSILTLEWERIPEFPHALVLRLKNDGARAICVPDVSVSEYIEFTQNGKRVPPFWTTNRAVLMWHGADLISGMIVVPPKRTVDVNFDLNQWKLKQGAASAKVAMSAYDCFEF